MARLQNILCAVAVLVAWSAAGNAGIMVHADKFVAAPGDTVELTLSMDCDSACYRGFQMELALPDGLTLVADSGAVALPFAVDTARLGTGHRLVVGEVAPGHYRMVCYSPSNAMLGGTSGAFVHFRVKAEDRAFNEESIVVSATGFANESNVTEHAGDTTVSAVYANPLSRVVAEGTDGHEYAVADTLTIGGYSAKGYVFLTDGKGGWLKVDLTGCDMRDFLDLHTIEPRTLVGTMTCGGVNPTLTLTSTPMASSRLADVELRTVRLGDLGTRRFYAAPNEVLKVAGFYVESAEGRQLRQYEQRSKEKGVALGVDLGWCNNTGDLVDDSPYTLPVVAQIRQAWTADSGSVAADDKYFENYVIYPLEVPIVTEAGSVDGRGTVRVIGQRGRILVLGADDAEVTILDVSGRNVASGRGGVFCLPQGIYAVLVDGKAHKVAVR